MLAGAVAVNIVDLLEIVEIHKDETEDAGGNASMRNERVEQLVEREAIVHVGKQIEL
jgi:hypothetical protein